MGATKAWISSDGGAHWQRYGRMVADAGTAQPAVIEVAPGHLRAWLRTRNFWNGENPAWACIYRAESHDNGRNWTRPVRTLLPNNNSSLQVICLRSGALALVYNHQAGRTRSPLNIALSYDHGDTWPVMRELEPFGRRPRVFLPGHRADDRWHDPRRVHLPAHAHEARRDRSKLDRERINADGWTP